MELFERSLITALADLFLPRLCCVCGTELGRNERHVCIGCLAGMPLTLSWTLRRNPMAERFNALIERNGRPDMPGSGDSVPAGDVPEAAEGVDSCGRYVDAVALFNFVKDGGYRNITYRLKYGRDIGEGRFFSSILGERAALAPWFADVDTVVPVPLHWTRRLRRGYNQAEVIARGVAGALGAEVRTDLLVRTRRTSTQTRLGIAEKARNVSGAFAVPDRASRDVSLRGIRHLLLVDDVFTTGSTLYNCYLPLRRFLGPDVRIGIATLGAV